MVRLEKEAGASFRMDPQDQQEAGERGSDWKERQELLSGWSFKGSRMLGLE